MRYVLSFFTVLPYFLHAKQLVSVISIDDEMDHDPHSITVKAPGPVKVKVKGEKGEKLPTNLKTAVSLKGKGMAKSSRLNAHKV